MPRSAFTQLSTETEQERLRRLARRYDLGVDDFTFPDSVRASTHVTLTHAEIRKLEKVAKRHGTTRTQLIRGMIRRSLREFDDAITTAEA